MPIGPRQSIVDYTRSTEIKKVGAAQVERIFYIYEMTLECGHKAVKRGTELGVPQFAYCRECKDKPRKRTRSMLSARFA